MGYIEASYCLALRRIFTMKYKTVEAKMTYLHKNIHSHIHIKHNKDIGLINIYNRRTYNKKQIILHWFIVSLYILDVLRVILQKSIKYILF